MIAYNTAWLDALLTKETAQEWHQKRLLSAEKWNTIQERNPANFYSPNVFVRIGLAIFCLILLMAVMGLAALISEPDSETGFSAFCFFWGVVWVVVLEFWSIRSARHRGSGIDDILLYTSTCMFLTSICSPLHYSTSMLTYCLIAWPFLAAGSIRYADRLMAAAAFVCSLLIVLLIVKDIPRVALYLLPFAGMLFSAGGWFFARQGQKRWEWRHWHNSLLVVELLSLLTFCASGNFWVVQQAGADLFGLEQVPMAGFFWMFTFMIPAIYISGGLLHKERHLLDMGLAAVAAALFTFRYYFHVMPLAWAAVIGGAVLFASAYLAIRYLRRNEGAYTYEAHAETSLLQEVEQQLFEQGIGAQNPPVSRQKESFGGGEFGGGGAGEEF